MRLRRRKGDQRSGSPLCSEQGLSLFCDQGVNNTQNAKRVEIVIDTIGRWRRRFAEHRIQALCEASHSGAPCKISDDKVSAITTLTLESKPKNPIHRSSRKMASQCRPSHDSVKRFRVATSPWGKLSAFDQSILR